MTRGTNADALSAVRRALGGEGCVAADDYLGDKPSTGHTTLIDTQLGAAVTRWNSRTDGQRFYRSLHVAAVAVSEARLPPIIAVPPCIAICHGGRYFTVTWLPPLLSDRPIDVAEGSALAAMEQCLRVSLGELRADVKVSMCVGVDGVCWITDGGEPTTDGGVGSERTSGGTVASAAAVLTPQQRPDRALRAVQRLCGLRHEPLAEVCHRISVTIAKGSPLRQAIRREGLCLCHLPKVRRAAATLVPPALQLADACDRETIGRAAIANVAAAAIDAADVVGAAEAAMAALRDAAVAGRFGEALTAAPTDEDLLAARTYVAEHLGIDVRVGGVTSRVVGQAARYEPRTEDVDAVARAAEERGSVAVTTAAALCLNAKLPIPPSLKKRLLEMTWCHLWWEEGLLGKAGSAAEVQSMAQRNPATVGDALVAWWRCPPLLPEDPPAVLRCWALAALTLRRECPPLLRIGEGAEGFIAACAERKGWGREVAMGMWATSAHLLDEHIPAALAVWWADRRRAREWVAERWMADAITAALPRLAAHNAAAAAAIAVAIAREAWGLAAGKAVVDACGDNGGNTEGERRALTHVDFAAACRGHPASLREAMLRLRHSPAALPAAMADAIEIFFREEKKAARENRGDVREKIAELIAQRPPPTVVVHSDVERDATARVLQGIQRARVTLRRYREWCEESAKQRQRSRDATRLQSLWRRRRAMQIAAELRKERRALENLAVRKHAAVIVFRVLWRRRCVSRLQWTLRSAAYEFLVQQFERSLAKLRKIEGRSWRALCMAMAIEISVIMTVPVSRRGLRAPSGLLPPLREESVDDTPHEDEQSRRAIIVRTEKLRRNHLATVMYHEGKEVSARKLIIRVIQGYFVRQRLIPFGVSDTSTSARRQAWQRPAPPPLVGGGQRRSFRSWHSVARTAQQLFPLPPPLRRKHIHSATSRPSQSADAPIC